MDHAGPDRPMVQLRNSKVQRMPASETGPLIQGARARPYLAIAQLISAPLSFFDRGAHNAPVFSPTAVVVLHIGQAQQILEYDPGVT
jgi:hypothetical protein